MPRSQAEGVDCKYSRVGIQRRERKRKASPSSPAANPSKSLHGGIAPTPSEDPGWEANLDKVREKMPPAVTDGYGPYKVLSSLADEVDAFWSERPDLADGSLDEPRSAKGYFLFEEHTKSWIEGEREQPNPTHDCPLNTMPITVFERAIQRYRPLLTPPPTDIIEILATCQPDKVRERAWLVLYYGVILSSQLALDLPGDQKVSARLRANLWLAFNDTRLLAEPSDPNIQALAFLACHVEPFSTPSLCWMLLSNACRMLRALAVNHRALETQTEERRLMLFWHLNALEKSMCLTFPWPGTFHRTMFSAIPLPTLKEILPCQPSLNSADRPSLWGAHYMHQSFSLSRIMTDVWCGLDENDARAQQTAKHALDAWHHEATQILEATALAEKPLLDAAGAHSMQIGLTWMQFQYYGTAIALKRGHSQEALKCHDMSLKMLRILKELVCTSAYDLYIGVDWQMLYLPWAPFLVLFGNIISSGEEKFDRRKKEQALEVMEELPVYLRAMSVRHRSATKLESMASGTVQRARSILFPASKCGTAITLEDLMLTGATDNVRNEQKQGLPTPSVSNNAATPGSSNFPVSPRTAGIQATEYQSGYDSAGPSTDPNSSNLPGVGPWLWGDMNMPQELWPEDSEDLLFADPLFDWFAWEGATSS
ncbi:hypothetical protein LTR15_001681 [Elasticomyces elasticus]|nr:hypothetical protein LTR15_001681 [Elasticomyces elasticus]